MDPNPTQTDARRRALASQGLTDADVEINRAGRVSPAQLARLDAVQKAGRVVVYGMLGGLSAISVAFGLYHYLRYGRGSIFVLPMTSVAFCAFIYFVVYRLNRLPLPEEIANARVTVLRAPVGGSLVGASRGVYNVWLNDVRYSGCAASLSAEVGAKGRVVDAYVIAERKLVVALVPAG